MACSLIETSLLACLKGLDDEKNRRRREGFFLTAGSEDEANTPSTASAREKDAYRGDVSLLWSVQLNRPALQNTCAEPYPGCGWR